MIHKITVLLVVFLPTFGCNFRDNPKLEFQFEVNKMEGFMPSYQLAIWLEKPDGEYVKTFFVCDYLSYGGYNIAGICPDWVSKAQWNKAHRKTVDAVTQATPDFGKAILETDCPKEELPYGLYKYFIEVHFTENYNELYSGDIEIKEEGNKIISNSVVSYHPKKYPPASGLLSNVKVLYKN